MAPARSATILSGSPFSVWIPRSLAASILLLAVTVAEALEFTRHAIGTRPVIVCRVDIKKDKLQLFHRDEHGQPFKRFERLAPWLAARGKKLLFAMNAGMYHGDFSAVGLFVADGKELVPLNTGNAEGNFFLKPNGVFAVTDAGACVVETSEYPRLKSRVILATQSGPLLVHRGKLHPAFNANSPSRLSRNGVGVPSPETALFAITDDPVNFHEFATFFRDTLKCPNALFLDGTISSLHAPELKRSDFRMDLGPIIGVTD